MATKRAHCTKTTPVPPPRKGAATSFLAGLGAVVMRLVVLGGFVPAVLVTTPTTAQVVVDKVQEYNVKSAYLYAMARNVEWPTEAFADASAPFLIGVVGVDPFGGALDHLAKTKKVRGRSIVIKRFEGPADAVVCHLIFIGAGVSPDEQASLAARLRGTQALIVGEAAGFLTRGGMVNFYLAGEYVKFEINLASAKQEGLTFDPKFLQVAKPAGEVR